MLRILRSTSIFSVRDYDIFLRHSILFRLDYPLLFPREMGVGGLALISAACDVDAVVSRGVV